jgi:hypothetical protein
MNVDFLQILLSEYCNVKEILILGFEIGRKPEVCPPNVAHSSYGEQDPDGAALN